VSSAKPGAYNLVRAGTFSARLPASALPFVSAFAVPVMPRDGLSFRKVVFLSSRSRSRDDLVGAGAIAVGFTLRMSLSRKRGRAGAGGILGAGIPDDESPTEEDDVRYCSSSLAAVMSSGGNSDVQRAGPNLRSSDPDVGPSPVEDDVDQKDCPGWSFGGTGVMGTADGGVESPTPT